MDTGGSISKTFITTVLQHGRNETHEIHTNFVLIWIASSVPKHFSFTQRREKKKKTRVESGNRNIKRVLKHLSPLLFSARAHHILFVYQRALCYHPIAEDCTSLRNSGNSTRKPFRSEVYRNKRFNK